MSIESVVQQSFENWELIISDNGSTDGSLDFCNSVSDSRIRVVSHTGPQTIADSLNFGVSLAKGSLVARIDSDDVAHPTRLSKQVSLLETDPEIGLVGSWMTVFGKRKTQWEYPVHNADVQLAMLFGNPFGHPAVMFRKNWDQGEVGYYDPKYDLAEDYELWARMSRQWKCVNIPEPLTGYRIHSRQATRSDSEERSQVVFEIREKHRAHHGLAPYPRNPSLCEFQHAWNSLEIVLRGRDSFTGSNFREQRLLQLRLLLRTRLTRIARFLGLAEIVIHLRNLRENPFKSMNED